jgi:hypothetical protein
MPITKVEKQVALVKKSSSDVIYLNAFAGETP